MTKDFKSDFAGNWDKGNAWWDRDTARSRAGYIITDAGCPVYRQSKLTTEIALSTAKAEYVAASEAIRSVIPMVRLMDELRTRGFTVFSTTPQLHCTHELWRCFEYLASDPKLS